MKKQIFIILVLAVLCGALTTCKKGTVYKTLIITGQSRYNWKTSSEAVKQILDETGMFSSEIMITPSKGENMSAFSPDFSKYKLVVFDYDGDPWSEKTNSAMTEYLNNGGGIVVYNTKSDPGGAISDSVTVSKRHNFEIRTRISDHPVTKGLPVRWLHPDDEIVQGLKVAGQDVQVLAAAFSETSFSGTGKFEPVLVARNYGKGRIFATLLGTPDENENQALHCTGFIVTLQRGAEWAATGSVTQEVPSDFPTAAGVVLRPDFKAINLDEAFTNISSYDITKSTKYYTFIQSEIRKAAGDEKALLKLEKKMVSVLNNKEATVEARKIILRELSWMGSSYCIPAIKSLSAVPELKDEVDFALTRLNALK
jgi:type 1 glutamine amidotransferase